MIREQTFNKSVDILVTAFFDGELLKGSCTKCAVGNLLGGAIEWISHFYTQHSTKKQVFNRIPVITNGESHTVHARELVIARPDLACQVRDMFEKADRLIEASDYSKEELMAIEHAFETAEEVDGVNSIDSQFNGLMAVMDVLFDIHQVDEGRQRQCRARFKAHPALA